MLGLELEIYGKKLYGGFEKGVVTITLSTVPNRHSNVLNFGGLDVSENNKEFKNTNWFLSKLKENDEFAIKVVDVKENSVSISIEENTCGLNPDEDLLNEYYTLKETLEKEGVL